MHEKIIRVLLIEDNPGDARLFSEMLNENSIIQWNIQTAETLKDGMAHLSKGDYDIVLLDLMLPDSDGLDTFDQAKKYAEDFPVIVTTGIDDEEIAMSAVRKGAQDYLVKGDVDSNLLKKAIKYAIERKQIEEELKKHRNSLEDMVAERTAELVRINRKLKNEIAVRKKTENVLKHHEEELEQNSRNLEETNTALKVLLKMREEDRLKLEQDVLSNVKELVMPYIEKMKSGRIEKNQMNYIETIENNLENIISPFLRNITMKHFNLTPREIQVANFVKEGKTTKEIASLLNVSTKSVDFHRNNIRIKLGLKNRKANLRSTLLSIS